ncbi:MAG: hypothetical protein V1879_03090 [Pseudomonadota bacterium]
MPAPNVMVIGCCRFASSGRPFTLGALMVALPRLDREAPERTGEAAAILLGSVNCSAMVAAASAVGRTRNESPATSAIEPAVSCSVNPVPVTVCPAASCAAV